MFVEQGAACNVGDGVGKAYVSANETVGGVWQQVDSVCVCVCVCQQHHEKLSTVRSCDNKALKCQQRVDVSTTRHQLVSRGIRESMSIRSCVHCVSGNLCRTRSCNVPEIPKARSPTQHSSSNFASCQHNVVAVANSLETALIPVESAHPPAAPLV